MFLALSACMDDVYKGEGFNESTIRKRVEVVDKELINPLYKMNDIMARSIHFIPGSHLVMINRSVDAYVIDLKTGQPVNRILSPDSEDFIKSISVSKQNNRVAVSTRKQVQVWDVLSMALMHSSYSQQNSLMNGLSNNGEYLIFNQRIYHISEARALMPVKYDKRSVDFDFSENGQYLAIEGMSDSVTIIDLKKQKQLAALAVNNISGIAIKDDGTVYIGGGTVSAEIQKTDLTTSIHQYSMKSGRMMAAFTPVEMIRCWQALKQDQLITVQVNGNVQLLDKDLRILHKLSLGGRVTACDVSEAGDVWVASETSGIYYVSADSMKSQAVVVEKFLPVVSSVSSIVVSESNNYIGVTKANPDDSVYIYNVN